MSHGHRTTPDNHVDSLLAAAVRRLPCVELGYRDQKAQDVNRIASRPETSKVTGKRTKFRSAAGTGAREWDAGFGGSPVNGSLTIRTAT